MSTNIPEFRSVMRGYDPAQVNAALARLHATLESAHREVADRTAELTTTQAAHAELTERLAASNSRIDELERAQLATTPDYEALGERIGTILHLADAEAQALRQSAEADAARVVEEARRAADARVEEAQRAAAARREEAEALHESQRVHAAAAAAEFESTLTARRDQAAQEFSAQLSTYEESLRVIKARADALQQETDAARAEAQRAAAHTIESAQADATQHVQQAREIAEEIRLEAERQLSAATQRRDRMNAQLVNVRQMLASLGDAAMAQLVPEDAPEPDAPTGARHDQAPPAKTDRAAVTR